MTLDSSEQDASQQDISPEIETQALDQDTDQTANASAASAARAENAPKQATAPHVQDQIATIVKRLMTCMDDLSAIYMQETEALRKANAKDFLKMQDEKLRQIKIYERGIADLHIFKSQVKSLPDDVKAQLKEAQSTFAKIIQGNKTAIENSQSAMHRVGQTLGTAIRRAAQKQEAINYAADGHLYSKQRKSISSGRIHASA